MALAPKTPVPSEATVQAVRAVVRMIEHSPRRWNQNIFHGQRSEGTAHCFASWTVKLAGHDVRALLTEAPDGSKIYHLARDLLGLTDKQAWKIFLYASTDDGDHPTVADFKLRITGITGVTFP